MTYLERSIRDSNQSQNKKENDPESNVTKNFSYLNFIHLVIVDGFRYKPMQF